MVSVWHHIFGACSCYDESDCDCDFGSTKHADKIKRCWYPQPAHMLLPPHIYINYFLGLCRGLATLAAHHTSTVIFDSDCSSMPIRIHWCLYGTTHLVIMLGVVMMSLSSLPVILAKKNTLTIKTLSVSPAYAHVTATTQINLILVRFLHRTCFGFNLRSSINYLTFTLYFG